MTISRLQEQHATKPDERNVKLMIWERVTQHCRDLLIPFVIHPILTDNVYVTLVKFKHKTKLVRFMK